MADRPIIFSGPMVRALLDGRKTQTRRLAKVRPGLTVQELVDGGERIGGGIAATREMLAPVRYAIGDRLYVREAWRQCYAADWYRDDLGRAPKPSELDPATTAIEYLADGERELGGRSYPSIHMPRWASRLTLTVEDVRVERLQAISEADAIAEGVSRIFPEGSGSDTGPNHFTAAIDGGNLNAPTARQAFELLWQMLHGEESWASNPFVVAVTFRVERGNIDTLAKESA